jgi:nucleolysin TIA-1/TIAR
METYNPSQVTDSETTSTPVAVNGSVPIAGQPTVANPQQPAFDQAAYQQWYYAQYYNQLAQYYAAQKAQSSISGAIPGIEQHNCRSLYIGNLHDKVSEPLLFDIFAAIGPVESCKLIKDKTSGSSAGYGFIDYYDHHTAAIALQQFSGRYLYGLEIKVNWAFASGQKEDTTGHYHIFVGDLSPDIEDKALFNAFSAFGTISDARIMWDQATGRSRGYGFVAFRRREDAQRALQEMNGEWLGNRPIRCNWANQKGTGIDEPAHVSGLDYAQVVKEGLISNTTVYIGNITQEVSEHAIRTLFNDYGILEEVKISPEKGFGFVRYQTHEAAARGIVGCHGRTVCGRVIKCSWGKDRGIVLPTSSQQPDYSFTRRL